MAQSGVQVEASTEPVDSNDRVFGGDQEGQTMRLMVSTLVGVRTDLCLA